jgi:hypothetical protein
MWWPVFFLNAARMHGCITRLGFSEAARLRDRSLDMRFAALAAGLCVGAATHAHAGSDVVLSFSFDSLLGAYDAQGPNQGVFTARAVDQPLLRTVGDFNRTSTPFGNADFPAGFVADANQADIFLEMTNTRTGPDTFSAVGSLTITDIDGDRFLTEFTGIWYNLGPGFAFFAFDPFINPRFESSDGSFNGYNGSYSLAGLTNLAGSQVPPVILGGPSFFESDFSDFAVGVFGQVIPVPGVAAMFLGPCLLVATRRRRA